MQDSGPSQHCAQCNAELVPNASFCNECGAAISWKTRALSWGTRLKHKTVQKLDEFKVKMDHQVSDYIRRLDSGERVTIRGYNIPEWRRGTIRDAMQSFQDRYLEGDATQEGDYQQWMDDLPQRLEEHNCIVCFIKWNDADLGNIVVCPHCQTGGHRNHIADWIKSKRYCPLCREDVTFREYILLK
ncbi:MAG: hypothetical protein ACXAE3_08280 [Candidatus Kariarchaeaceae archaeon]|jgi:hypothetical protein